MSEVTSHRFKTWRKISWRRHPWWPSGCWTSPSWTEVCNEKQVIQSPSCCNISPALAHSDDVSGLDVSEAGREMDRHVLVSLLEPVVLLDVVEIVASHYNRPVHLHLGDDSSQDSSADRNLNIFCTTQSFPLKTISPCQWRGTSCQCNSRFWPHWGSWSRGRGCRRTWTQMASVLPSCWGRWWAASGRPFRSDRP